MSFKILRNKTPGVGFRGRPVRRYFWRDALFPGPLAQDSAQVPTVSRAVCPSGLTGKVLPTGPVAEPPEVLGDRSVAGAGSPRLCLCLCSFGL